MKLDRVDYLLVAAMVAAPFIGVALGQRIAARQGFVPVTAFGACARGASMRVNNKGPTQLLVYCEPVDGGAP